MKIKFTYLGIQKFIINFETIDAKKIIIFILAILFIFVYTAYIVTIMM